MLAPLTEQPDLFHAPALARALIAAEADGPRICEAVDVVRLGPVR